MKHEIKRIVNDCDLAVNVKSGEVNVLSTPIMAAAMEQAAAELSKTLVADDKTTVGIELNLKHIAATPVGMEISAIAELIEQSEKIFKFKIECFDEKELIGTASHTRAVVNKERFEKKASEKLI